jgi:hypothetical protein
MSKTPDKSIDLRRCLCSPQSENRELPLVLDCKDVKCSYRAIGMSHQAINDAITDHEVFHSVSTAYNRTVA